MPSDQSQPPNQANDDFTWLSAFSPRTFGIGSSGPPSVCGCGPSCACLGCMEHRGPEADTSQQCMNPASCMACFNSMALPTSPRSMRFDPNYIMPEEGLPSIDDWLSPAALNPPQSPTSSGMTATSSYLRARYPPIQSQVPEDMYIDPKLRGSWNNDMGSRRNQDQIQAQWSSSTGSTSSDMYVKLIFCLESYLLTIGRRASNREDELLQEMCLPFESRMSLTGSSNTTTTGSSSSRSAAYNTSQNASGSGYAQEYDSNRRNKRSNHPK